jgi:hypothetical protein
MEAHGQGYIMPHATFSKQSLWILRIIGDSAGRPSSRSPVKVGCSSAIAHQVGCSSSIAHQVGCSSAITR